MDGYYVGNDEKNIGYENDGPYLLWPVCAFLFIPRFMQSSYLGLSSIVLSVLQFHFQYA